MGLSLVEEERKYPNCRLAFLTTVTLGATAFNTSALSSEMIQLKYILDCCRDNEYWDKMSFIGTVEPDQVIDFDEEGQKKGNKYYILKVGDKREDYIPLTRKNMEDILQPAVDAYFNAYSDNSEQLGASYDNLLKLIIAVNSALRDEQAKKTKLSGNAPHLTVIK